MGCGSSKCCNEEMRQLRERNKLLEEELRKNLRMREEDSKVGLRKEEEWKDERKRLVDVYVMMRKKMDEETSGGGTNRCYLAVEKWKQLYFAIKTELDHLILRTAQGIHVFILISIFIFFNLILLEFSVWKFIYTLVN